MIVGLGRRAQVGKSTTAEIMDTKHGFERGSFAAALKLLAMKADPPILAGGVVNVGSGRGRLSNIVQMEGWENAKKNYPEVRQFLQRLGVGCREVFGEDVWVNALFRGWVPGDANVLFGLSKMPDGVDYVVDDVRFRNEAQRIKDLGGFVVDVVRPGRGPVNDHVSEHDLDDWDFDYVLHNDGTVKDLAERVGEMLAGFRAAAVAA